MTATAHLQHFESSEILLDQQQAWDVLRFFWPHTNVKPGSLTQTDREFAQALLVEAVDASYAMGFVEAAFRSLAKLPKGLGAVLKSFAKRAAKQWFKHATQDDLADPEIYESVRARLALNFRSTWTMREQGLPLTW